MNLPSLARMFPTEKRTPGHLMKTRAFRGWWPIRTGLFMVLITIAAGCGSGSSSSRLANIVVSPSAASVIINGTQQFTATAMDANGNPQSSVAFTWSSTANGVATVNTNWRNWDYRNC